MVGERKQAHGSLVRYLQSAQYRDLKRKWEHIVSDEKGSLPDKGPPVQVFAARQISDLYQNVRAMGKEIDERTPDKKLHKLRIACKKLRYTTEFFESLFAADAVNDFIAHLKKLQDNLGAFNDLSVQQRYLHGFAVEGGNGDTPTDEQKISFGMLIGSLYQQQLNIKHRFRENFRYFSEAGDLYWTLVPDTERGEEG